MTAEIAHDLIEMQSGAVVPVLSKALRAMFVAGPGMKLVGGDFSGIEGRVNAWFAGAEWKLQAFREYDAGIGPNLYNLAYARSFGMPPESVRKGSIEYDIGKKAELACGFGGAVGAFLRFSPNVAPIVAAIRSTLYGSEAWRLAGEKYDRSTVRYGLTPDEWVSVRVVVDGWREANQEIVQMWWALGDAAIAAVDRHGEQVEVCGGRVRYGVFDGALWCRLPSGKLLAYMSPRLVETREDFLVDADGEMFPVEEFAPEELDARLAAGGTIREGRPRVQVQFQGKNQKTGQWGAQRLYGGLQCNNICQSTAREILREAMHGVEAAGYPVVLHVHDELVSEVAREFGSAAHYEGLMSALPPWCAGLPLVAKGWEDMRYVK